jgi:hypothetical protein
VDPSTEKSTEKRGNFKWEREKEKKLKKQNQSKPIRTE